MAIIQIKRTTTPTTIPSLGELSLGELAINLDKGDIFFEGTGSNYGIQRIFTTTPNTGSLVMSGSIRIDGDGTFLDVNGIESFKIKKEGYIVLTPTGSLPQSPESGSIVISGSKMYVFM